VCHAATFGTVVPVIGGASDIVLDEARKQLYLVNTSKNQVEVYSTTQKKLLTPIKTDGSPLTAAISRSGKYLYVTASTASSLDIIDLDKSLLVSKVTLPAQPEGVAVGNDERVLISTAGSGTGNASNVLMIYDPSVTGTNALNAVAIAPPPPLAPNLPGTTGKAYLSSRSQLQSSQDGRIIVGMNIQSTTLRTVFVYDVASGTVLRSRYAANPSSVIAIAPDNSKFMAGSTLFDASTLQVLAQENLANSPYLIATNANFNTQTNQGGSVFAPDGSVLYAAFDISPQTNPATPSNVSELMFNDPDNLLIQMALQLPENLAGKLVISSDSANLYALSDSGFLAIPIGTTYKNPIAMPDSSVVLLSNDQCGALASKRTSRVTVNNLGTGRLTVSSQVITVTANGAVGLGGNTGGGAVAIGGGFGAGPGGGVPGGGGITIIVAPTTGTTTGATSTSTSLSQTAPVLRVTPTSSGATLDFAFNANAAKALGTISPSHDFDIQAPEAINIPPRVRVYQNNRNSEAQGELIPVPVGVSANEALEDLIYDSTRQRVYIANSGMNRVEVFDIAQHKFLAGIKVGQLPRSMAMTPDASTLYVANSGGESISIVDLGSMQATGRVKFPPTPVALNQAISTPSVISSGLSGPLFLMTITATNGTSTGSIWQVIGNQAVQRGPSQVIGTATGGAAKTVSGPYSMASTPGGEFIVIAGADGSTYLYDALADTFVQSRTLPNNYTRTTGLGYWGPLTAGPKGAYYFVNGQLLNSTLDPVNPAISGTTSRPVAALSPGPGNSFVRFTQAIRTSTTALASDPGTFETVDANLGVATRSIPALEGPMAQVTTTGRATAISGRTMAVDASGTTAYAVSTTGLSIIPLTPVPATAAPRVATKGAVNLTTYQTTLSPNTLLSIFGTNLGDSAQATAAPLPTVLGGTCVTLSNTPLPLFITTSGQINAQIPPETVAGTYSLVVRSITNKAASAAQSVVVSKYSPSIFVDPATNQIALLHADGKFVNKSNPASRDEPLTLYASGLGATKNAKAVGSNPSPSSPLAQVAGTVNLYFGDPTISYSGIIVDWAGLAPGMIGVYQLNIRVPGTHVKGDALPVTLKVAGVSSPTTGPLLPTVAVQ
jgi:uncharacterized protein (TIGR03437 family)